MPTSLEAQGTSLGSLAKLSHGVRANSDLSKASAGLSRGPSATKKLVAAAWSNTFPAQGATLDLDFANDRGFVRGVGQGKSMDAVTFTRAASGNFVKPDGTLSSHSNQGALGNNLQTVPQDFDTAPWSLVNATISTKTTIAPNGTNTGSKLTENTTNGEHSVRNSNQALAVPAATYTLSIYAKAAEITWLVIRETIADGSTFVNTFFNLATGVVGTVGASRTASILDAGNGWYRCSITVTSNGTGANRYYGFQTSTDGSVISYAGTNTSGLFLWGAQLEVGSSATEYFPTNINTPRFDWASSTQLPRNVCTYTEQLDNAIWTKLNCSITADNTTAPDGTNTADLITPSTTGGNLYQQINNLTAGTYTLSMYVKAGTANSITISLVNIADLIGFNPQTGVITGGVAAGQATVTNIGSGWYRVQVYFLCSAGNFGPSIKTSTASGNVYIWGVQFETGSTATTYQAIGAQSPTNTPLAANSTSNGLLIEEARTNRLLWNRDATSGTGTNLIIGSQVSAAFYPTNGTLGTVGSELVTNGDFSSSTGWTLGTGWTISGGTVNANIASGFAGISQSLALTAGKAYLVSYEITSRTSGSVGFFLGNSGSSNANQFGTTHSAVGVYSTVISFASGEALVVQIRSENGFVGSIDNISVKEITANNVTDPISTSTASIASATSANATFTKGVLVQSSSTSFYTFSVYLRRKTGTGTVEITANSSTGWVAQTITSSWARYSVTQTFNNPYPFFGLRITTSGDEVEIWGQQLTSVSTLTDYQETIGLGLIGWSKSNVTVAKNQTGIDGVANACTSITATANNAVLIQPIQLASGSRTSSVYLKRITGTGNVQVTMDGTTYSTVDLSNGLWNRIVLSGTVTNPTVGIKIVTSGDAVAMDYGQVEDGACVTSPILTTSATVTRSADVVNIGGVIYRNFYNPQQGTFLATGVLPDTIDGLPLLGFGGIGTSSIYHVTGTAPATAAWWNGSSVFQTANSAIWRLGVTVAGAYDTYGRYLCMLNGPVAQNTSLVTDIGILYIGRSVNGSNYANGTIKRVSYFNKKLNNNSLQNITSGAT